MDITLQQAAQLQRLMTHGFQIVAFPMYESYVGVRKGNCAALLAPQASGGLALFGHPAYLVAGNLGVKMIQSEGHYFVSKKEKLPVTPEREKELEEFAAQLSDALLPTA
jgi:hypothetical protein